LPICVTEAAHKIFERVRHNIEQDPLDNDQQQIHYIVSIGFSEVTSTDQHSEDIFKRADKALYQAKANERNQVFCGNTAASHT
jgi:diguanylate cyclase (GGDEF)-like protein